jgi:hypothetical protein
MTEARGKKPERKGRVVPVERVIITKHRIYRLPLSVRGTPIEDYWPGVIFPKELQGAKVYQTEDGEVVATALTETYAPAKRSRQALRPKPAP